MTIKEVAKTIMKKKNVRQAIVYLFSLFLLCTAAILTTFLSINILAQFM